jgi:hypothetical protein
MQNGECRMQNAECRVQSAVSRKKQLITVFFVANAQKQGEQVIKRLITVFDEAMSHDASIARRVYRAEAVRHISGRAPAQAECIEASDATMFQELVQ